MDLGEHGPAVSVTVCKGQRTQAKVSAEQPDQDASCQKLHPQGQQGQALLQTSRVTTGQVARLSPWILFRRVPCTGPWRLALNQPADGPFEQQFHPVLE